MDDHCEQPALGIDQDVPLAPGEFPGPVEAAHSARVPFDASLFSC
jgi:hypothetical protein